MKYFPAGGWGWGWAGEADRGFGPGQPGGWAYNCLPFMELKGLHDMNKGKNVQGTLSCLETPLAVFICPTRRKVVSNPFQNGSNFANFAGTSLRPARLGGCDYAGNGGDVYNGIPYGPSSLADADANWGPSGTWYSQPGGASSNTGIFGVHMVVKPAEIVDGTSKTYLVAERYIQPETYYTGVSYANDQGWNMGYDFDSDRWTTNDGTMYYQPMRDRQGFESGYNFGSAHGVAFNAVLCDGSVHPMAYTIDLDMHQRLGARNDRKPIDSSKIW
jgi:hypothetical protein